MSQLFGEFFTKYPQKHAPFLHEQYSLWSKSQPLKGLRILHHVPVVQNVLLKIANLVAAGANITITNPDFLSPSPTALSAIKQANLRYVDNIYSLRGEQFDIYYDCGAICYQAAGAPRIGAVELTGSGDNLYRTLAPATPVISIDRSLTKQLETIFGMAVSSQLAIEKLTGKSTANKSWLVFGFGKIGRGIAYLCKKQGYDISIIDCSAHARTQATELGIRAYNTDDADIKNVIQHADIIITATGHADILKQYDKSWFEHKTLVNMGILDEFGPRFDKEVLNNKLPINFILEDPTPIIYIDAEMYAHNEAAMTLLQNKLANGVHPMPPKLDHDIINRWCEFHREPKQDIQRWFIPFNPLDTVT